MGITKNENIKGKLTMIIFTIKANTKTLDIYL